MQSPMARDSHTVFVFPTSRVGYYAGKPIESVVCNLNNLRICKNLSVAEK